MTPLKFSAHGFRAMPVTCLVSCLVLSSCATLRTSPEPRVVDGQTYGTTSVPFRGRWWQFYERGVSWSRGGFWAEAESDFRAALTLRQTDSRRARTYGMHFVQCFVHRELGAVLVEQQRWDEAESELRLSLAQEPSAKAEFLLARIATARGALAGAAVAAVPAAAVPPAAAPVAAPQLPSRVVIDRAEPGPGNLKSIAGHYFPSGEQPLEVLNEAGAARVIAVAADGAFTAELAPGEVLVTRAAEGKPVIFATAEPAPVAPSLILDGPENGAVITANRAWFRFSAQATAGLTGLVISDGGGGELVNQSLSGVAAGGTLAVPLTNGRHVLRFTLRLTAGEVVVERTVIVAPTPDQDRTLRATAMMLPLQTPSDGGGIKATDDPELLSSVSRDGRFRLVDTQADALLTRELSLVDAGYVDRVTAANAGRRLASRYVLTGTLRRGRNDVECFVRLVNVDSKEVVASADAYSQAIAPAQEQAFFALVAGRLHQEFPVLQATLATDERGVAIIDRGSAAGVVGRMIFFAVDRGPDVRDPATGQVVLAGDQRVAGTLEVADVEDQQARMKQVSGTTPTGAVVVSE